MTGSASGSGRLGDWLLTEEAGAGNQRPNLRLACEPDQRLDEIICVLEGRATANQDGDDWAQGEQPADPKTAGWTHSCMSGSSRSPRSSSSRR